MRNFFFHQLGGYDVYLLRSFLEALLALNWGCWGRHSLDPFQRYWSEDWQLLPKWTAMNALGNIQANRKFLLENRARKTYIRTGYKKKVYIHKINFQMLLTTKTRYFQRKLLKWLCSNHIFFVKLLRVLKNLRKGKN